MNIIPYIALGAALAGLPYGVCGAAALVPSGSNDVVDERQPLDTGGSLKISDNLPGAVAIVAWDRSEVGVSGLSGCSQNAWGFSGTPSELILAVKLSAPSRNVADCKLRIQVPAAAQLNLKTVSADVSLSGVHGPLDISTVSGDLTLQSGSQDVSLRTVSGDLHVSGVQGRLSVDTVSGNLSLDGARLSELDSISRSGDIHLDGVYAPHARISGSTISGDITVHLPKDMSGSIHLSSLTGELPCAGDDSAAGRHGHAGLAKTCEYLEGDGKGANLVLSSKTGDLRIDPAPGVQSH